MVMPTVTGPRPSGEIRSLAEIAAKAEEVITRPADTATRTTMARDTGAMEHPPAYQSRAWCMVLPCPRPRPCSPCPT